MQGTLIPYMTVLSKEQIWYGHIQMWLLLTAMMLENAAALFLI